QNHWTTIDVMTRAARNSTPAIAEQLAIKLRGLVEIVHLQNDPVECWSHFNSFHLSFDHRLTQMSMDQIMAPRRIGLITELMDSQIEALAETIWNYHLMNHEVALADAILVLCSHDERVAERGAQLFLDGFAP